MSASATGTPIATARTPGFDVARAAAVLGMVLVNYSAMLDAGARGPDWLVWSSERLEGRASALFVLLAGVGVSLRSRRARQDPAQHLGFERAALIKRAGVLFVAGLLNLHMWEWDILHFYGLFLAVAALFLNARGWLLGASAVACVMVSALLQAAFDYELEVDLWSGTGALSDLFFNGPHPFFPWMAFVLAGMGLGRLDLRDELMRRRVLIFSLVAVFLGELIDSVGGRLPWLVGFDADAAAWLSSWPRPPRPGYVIAALGTASAVICVCIEVTQRRLHKRWVVALTATGQLAFTLYILHAVAILVPLQHGLLEKASLALSMAYGMGFYVVAVALSVWWRRRFAYGPLEGLIRQITGRTSPGPWGGELVSGTKD